MLADPLLGRVFSILLDNSRRHGRRADRIIVTCSIEDDVLTVIYQDNGVGIKMQDKDKIFELGYGTDSGLGLYLARQILEVTEMSN